jgi:hypothetical protein
MTSPNFGVSKIEQRGDLLPSKFAQVHKNTASFSIEDYRDFQGVQMSQIARPTTPGVYDPKALTAMEMAFDVALDAFPDKDRSEARIRRELALLIIYLADQGETDPTRLSRSALVRMMKRGDDLSLAARIFGFRLIANQPLWPI